EAIQSAHVRSNVSIKLTQIGLKLDKNLCASNVQKILDLAKSYNNFVRIDMEDAACVDDTLDIFYEMRVKKGYENVGIVIQAYLYRTMNDLTKLMEIPARVRLCKGAYKESDEVAYPLKKDVDANYDRASQLLLDTALKVGAPTLSPDGLIPPIPGIATHDEKRINHALNYAKQIGLPMNAMEFQMLYGIRRDIQIQLAQQGYPVRIYVPFGTEWYAYNMRRLAERPANLWFFISNFFKK
ncbi:MAG: proline dehydrogenase family protein, partial [Anaerolineales bacterium]